MAFRRESRYRQTRGFEPGIESTAVFPGTRARDIEPGEGVLEHTVQAGQRLDLLALSYYNDTRAWWRILDVNPQILSAATIVLDEYEGATIVIPRLGAAQ